MISPPTRFVIDSTARCNNRCFYCPTGAGLTRHRPFLMPWDLFSKITDEIEGYVTHVYLEYLGEPTMHPRLGDMIDRIQEFATVDIATNATLIDEEMAGVLAKCETISVSICGLHDVYKQVHGVDNYLKAMCGLVWLLKAAPGRVNWTWIALKDNENQVGPAQFLALKLGARLGVKGCSLGLFQRDRSSTHSYWNRYDGVTLKYGRTACREFWQVGYVCTDGSVPMCGFDYKPIFPMGSLYEQTFLEVWNGGLYQAAREAQLAGKPHQMCRRLCGHG